jgi:hypothetical protein
MKSTTTIIVASVCMLASCKQESRQAAAPAPATPSTAMSEVLANVPAAAPKAIHTIRKSAKPGDEITISGRIMGNDSPFVDGRAVFILGDPELLTPCNELPGDNCETPWDVCCEPPEDKKSGIATIQIVGADGRVLKEGIEGVSGLVKLAHVTVTGKVAEGSSADLLLVNATAIRAGK